MIHSVLKVTDYNCWQRLHSNSCKLTGDTELMDQYSILQKTYYSTWFMHDNPSHRTACAPFRYTANIQSQGGRVIKLEEKGPGQ